MGLAPWTVTKAIKKAVKEVDSMLALYMVRECEYRNDCHEDISCGYWEKHK